ncbi:MAG: transglycosylase domain-containing protein [Candidatus Staskawiczbacteria bacterium]|nr:transglycosylase domain-containing protein [Candidatus Staskawiczbacteria bacterium]
MKLFEQIKKTARRHKTVIALILGAFLFLYILLYALNTELTNSYNSNQSFSVTDRNNNVILISKNPKGYYAEYSAPVPDNFKKLLIEKEDKYFYWHFGFNFLSIFEAVGNKLGLSQRKASSTISQQLTKILLQEENQRNINNKIKEAFYTLALETFNSKEKILEMYANSVYFGSQLQGIRSAGKAYFNVAPQNLTTGQIVQLLATLSSPTDYNPAGSANIEKSKILSASLGVKNNNFTQPEDCQKNIQNYVYKNQPILELAPYLSGNVNKNLQLTVDSRLMKNIRDIVSSNIDVLKNKKAKNAAVVILSAKDNQVLALIGSPDPSSFSDGYKIDMSLQPRQIGSTVKPFIYLLGFENGMRPYTLIDDREYKYLGPGGYPIYPKNYDFKYHGLMTAHYALDNSINVAAVKTLEFAGIDNFNKFLTEDLGYKTIQPIDQYQLGIALGNLEMNLLDLTHYFSIFPNQGKLNGLKIFTDGSINNNYFPYQNKDVAPKKYVELINKILSDRKTGIDQFGAESSLNLQAKNYALKTGTSHDYIDSWIVGYTPDFLVGVWVGNADNSPTDAVSGQTGAGRIWNEVMQLMLNSEYNQNSQFDFSDIKEYQGKNGIEYGLANDDFKKSENIIENQDKSFILNPHDDDVFIFTPGVEISLEAKDVSDWKIIGPAFAETTTGKQKIFFAPKKEGSYEITASSKSQNETITVRFIKQTN